MNNDELTSAAETFLHERIPLTRAMGIRVVSSDERGFAVSAPVALNHNHLHTAFGGSINAVATLAAYGLLWLELRDEAVDVVIRNSSIRFLRPIRETISAVCTRPQPERLSEFKATLKAKEKAQIALRVRVEENGALAAELDGTFVTLRQARS
jgi:thioesterase domain-containing protein